MKASDDSFDLGTVQWDQIVMVFAWAPVADPAFPARLRPSLRPGGRVVFDHFVDVPGRPRPKAIQALQPGEPGVPFNAFRIDHYEEVDGVGEWGRPADRRMHLVAVKR